MKKALVIGSGIAGIATAIRLRCMGFEVIVFEANSYPGGKLSEIIQDGYRFDAGPSLFTMPQFVEELFVAAQKPIEKYFSYQQKKVICNYFYPDGTRFSAKADKEEFINDAAETFCIQPDVLRSYLDQNKRKYDLTHTLFLEKSLHQLSTYLSKETLIAIGSLQKLSVTTSLHQHNTKALKNQKLVQFFNRFATYNGSSPYKTPGIMSMIPYLEMEFGTFFPDGGMHQITESLYRLSLDLGVQYQFNTKVSRILVTNKLATGIRVGNTIVVADMVVSNTDVVPTYRKLLPDQKAPERTLSQERSSSALIFYWGITNQFPQLDLHNIFFSKDYKKEFDEIFEQHTIPEDPTVYVNISAKNAPNDAPKGCENWFVMINVPTNSGQDWDRLIEKARIAILRSLSKALETDISALIQTESILDPRTIESKTQSYQGSLYGAASNSKFAAFLRHPNFSRKIKNLYFCGGSVHPGGGIPLCLLSAKIVADLVQKEQSISTV